MIYQCYFTKQHPWIKIPNEYFLFELISHQDLALALSKEEHVICLLSLLNNVVFRHKLNRFNVLYDVVNNGLLILEYCHLSH